MLVLLDSLLLNSFGGRRREPTCGLKPGENLVLEVGAQVVDRTRVQFAGPDQVDEAGERQLDRLAGLADGELGKQALVAHCEQPAVRLRDPARLRTGAGRRRTVEVTLVAHQQDGPTAPLLVLVSRRVPVRLDGRGQHSALLRLSGQHLLIGARVDLVGDQIQVPDRPIEGSAVVYSVDDHVGVCPVEFA